MRGKPKLLNPNDKDRPSEHRGPLIGTPPSSPPDPKAIAFVCFAIALETAMLIRMYGVYGLCCIDWFLGAAFLFPVGLIAQLR